MTRLLGVIRLIGDLLAANLLPALLMGVIARPGWLSAFPVGMRSSTWMSDRYEKPSDAWLRRKLGQ